MKHRYRYVVFAMAAFAATPVFAVPQLRAGLWEEKDSNEAEISGMGKLPANIDTQTFCLDEKELADMVAGKLPPEMQGMDCAKPKSTLSGNTFTFDVDCMGMHSHAVTTIISDSEFTTTGTVSGPMTVRGHTVAKRIGDCPKKASQ